MRYTDFLLELRTAETEFEVKTTGLTGQKNVFLLVVVVNVVFLLAALLEEEGCSLFLLCDGVFFATLCMSHSSSLILDSSRNLL